MSLRRPDSLTPKRRPARRLASLVAIPGVSRVASPARFTSLNSSASNLGRMVIVNLGLTALGLVAAGLVPFGFNLAVSHHDGAATLGHVAIALNLALLLGQIPGTISTGATKFIAEALGAGDERRARRVFRFLLIVTVCLSCALAGAIVGLSPLLERGLHLSATMVTLAAALIPAYALYLYFKSCYYGFQQVRTYLFNEILADAAFFGVLATVFLLGATPWLLLPFILNNVIFAAVAITDLGPYLFGGGPPQPGERRSAVIYCLINGGGSAASLSRWSLGTVIAGWYLSSHQVGIFAAAVAITAPLALLPRAISLVTFALMARLHGAGDSASIRTLLQRSTEWLVFLLGIPSGLAIINASPLLGGLFGSAFTPAATAAQLIIAGAFITDISRPSIDALASTSHVRVATIASLYGLALSVVLWLALIPPFGISMAGLGFAAGAAMTALVPAAAAIRFLGSEPSVFVKPAIMLAGVLFIVLFLQGFLLLASAIFVAGMCALYLGLIRELVEQLPSLLRPVRAAGVGG